MVNVYRQTGMGRSITERPVLREGTYYHKASNRHYVMTGGAISRYQVDGEGRPIHLLERTADFAVGSGNHAITYLHRTAQGRLFELPVSWYRELTGYAMSPGYDHAGHFDFRREVSEACLFCHSNGARPEPIGCERCHGSGAAHRQKPGRGNILNPRTLPAERQLDVCLQCHLETTSNRFTDSLRRPGREVFSYRPGEPLGDYKMYFAAVAEEERLEINHAGYRLMQSRCFQESQGKMTCTTCHEPHTAQVKARACQGCHTQPHVEGDCAACHMPKRRTADAIHVRMTEHRVQREPRFTDPSREDLTPYAGPLRNFYTTADALSQERAETRAPTVGQLRRFVAANPRDAGGWTALGSALVRAGEAREAVTVLEKALSLKPRETAAETSLGVAYAVQGELRKSLAVLERAVAANPDYALAWINLGITREALKDREGARAAYDRAILLQPDALEARRRRQALR